MSGPSETQLNLQQEQLQFYQEANQEAATTFGEQQSLLKEMESVYSPILAQGPNRKGFSGAEEAELEGKIQQGTAANYSRAARAVNENLATEGAGNPLQSGTEQALREEVALSAAGEQSREEQQALEADYAEGEHQFEMATGALADVSKQFNPIGFGEMATSAGSATEKTASDIVSEENSWMAPVFGAIGAIGGAAAGGL